MTLSALLSFGTLFFSRNYRKIVPVDPATSVISSCTAEQNKFIRQLIDVIPEVYNPEGKENCYEYALYTRSELNYCIRQCISLALKFTFDVFGEVNSDIFSVPIAELSEKIDRTLRRIENDGYRLSVQADNLNLSMSSASLKRVGSLSSPILYETRDFFALARANKRIAASVNFWQRAYNPHNFSDPADAVIDLMQNVKKDKHARLRFDEDSETW